MKKTTRPSRRTKHQPNTRRPSPAAGHHPPLVLCLTNTVAANFTANVLLAIGAKPAMVEDPDEAAELAAVADAVLVNVGTLTAAQSEAMLAAVESCRAHGTPWVLDPVAVQALSYRRAFIVELLAHQPTLIRGNIDEIRYLREHFSKLVGPVPMLATGAVDEITWGQTLISGGQSPIIGGQSLKNGDSPSAKRGQSLKISGGVSMLQNVTATGCAQGAICAAYLGGLSPKNGGLSPKNGGLSPVEAAVAASRLMKRAGARAWERAKTPGAFQMALLDALWELTHQ